MDKNANSGPANPGEVSATPSGVSLLPLAPGERAAEQRLRVGIVSLGCAKNLVDAEVMLGCLIRDGVEITNDAAEADAVILNTCSFIDSAQEESVDAILESGELREAKQRGQALVVAGCLPQRFREDLPKLLPEVDAFMGIDQVTHVTSIIRDALSLRARKLEAESATGIGSVVSSKRRHQLKQRLGELDAGKPDTAADSGGGLRGTSQFGATRKALPATASKPAGPLIDVTARPKFVPDYATPRFRLTPRHYAFVKIAEGCNHPCSFCIIPRMRGSHRSRRQPDIVAEARELISQGVRELNLISQDSTYYGMDFRPNRGRVISSPDRFSAAVRELPIEVPTICTLLRELDAIPGDFWIRLLYTHPAHWTDDLIQTMAECGKVVRYVDIPLQHIHANMLERMRRETSREHIEGLLQRIRLAIPGITLRTTFIVGFPGETETCFESLMQFIRQTRFERLGVFTYSREEGTRAGAMAGQIAPNVRKKRRDRAMLVQREIANAVAESFVGRTIRVLVEGPGNPSRANRLPAGDAEHGATRAKRSEPLDLNGPFSVARGEADAPDIDGRVYVKGRLPAGEFALVRVTGHTVYDLLAEPAS